MITKEKVFDLASRLIQASPADDTEVFFHEGESNLTRFANNTIHQNVSITNAEVVVRVAFGKKVGVASSNTLETAKNALDEACRIARVSEDSPTYAGMPAPLPVKHIHAFDDAAAGCDAAGRAARVKNVVEEAKRVGAIAAGAYSTNINQVAVANSKGIQVHHSGTDVNLNIVMMKGGGSGTAFGMGWRLSDVDEVSAAKMVASRTLATDKPRDIEPGEYAVVLEPQAVAVLARFLAYLGFNGKAYQEKRSFMSGKMGARVTGELITLVDDGLDPAGMPLPFDFEGVPKTRVVFIDKGVATGMCYDTATAAAGHTQSTGHALPGGSTYGPLPLNLAMAPGDSSLEKMIESTAKGLLVCNFHYANVAEPMKTVVTGMTRFGLFLIEDGRVVCPVKNLRFTQNVLEAFASATALTSRREPAEGPGGMMLVPGMKCTSFNFSGKTEF
jgi:predicted Zn-dependent protease